MFPFEDQGQNPEEVDNDRVPLHNYHIDVLFVLVVLLNYVIEAIDPHASDIESQKLFESETCF